MRGGKAVRALRTTLTMALALTFFTASLLFGAVVHLRLPVARTATARLLQQYLSALLQGTIEIDSVSQLSGGNISLKNVQVFDPDGRLVLSARRLDASIDPVDLMRRTLAPLSKLSIEIKYVGADGVDVHLLPSKNRSATGSAATLSLVDAFTPHTTSSSTKSTNARPLRIWMPKIVLREAVVNGALLGSPVLHTEVERANAKLLITDKGVLLDVDRFGLRSSGMFGVDTSARGEVHLRVPGPVYGNVSGELGEIPLKCHFRVEDGHLDVTVDLPRLQPSQVRPVLGSWPLDEDVALTGSARGKLPDVRVEARASALSVDRTESFLVAANGTARLTQDPQFDLRVTTQDLDASKLIHRLPRSHLDSETDLSLKVLGSRPTLTAKTQLHPSTIQDMALPPARIETRYEAESLAMDAWIDEPNLVAQAELRLRQNAPLNLALDIQRLSLDNQYVSSWTKGVQGKVAGTLHVTYGSDGIVSARTELQGTNLAYTSIRARSATLIGTTSGHLDRLADFTADGSLELTELASGDLSLKKITLRQQGRVLSPHLKLSAVTPRDLILDAQADAHWVNQSARNIDASLVGDGEPITLSAAELAYKDGRFLARDFVLKSIGQVRGNIDFGRAGGRIDLAAQRLDISRISQRFGLGPGELGGQLDGNVQLEIGQSSHGTVELFVNEASYKGLVNSTATFSGKIQGSRVKANGRLAVPGLGNLSSKLDLEVTGSPLVLNSWRLGQGSLKSEISELDLKTVSMLTGINRELDLTGKARLKLDVVRASHAPPDFSLSIQTKDLTLGFEDGEGNRHMIQGVDVHSLTKANLTTSDLESALRLEDGKGQIVSVSGSQKLPLLQWWQSPPPPEELNAALLSAPLELVALVPERKISQLPLASLLPLRSGKVGARMAIGGSLAQPSFAAMIAAEDLLASTNRGLTRPVDARLNVRYSAKTGAFVGNVAFDDDEHPLGNLSAELNVPWQHLKHNPGPKVPIWTGSAQLQLEGLPLEIVQLAASNEVRGMAEGTITIQRQDLLPEIRAEMGLSRVFAAGYHIGDAHLVVTSNGPKVTARTDFTDDFGELSAQAEFTIALLADGLGLDPAQDIVFEVRSNKYNAAAAGPFLKETLDEIAGQVSGQLALRLSPPQDKRPARAKLTGDLKLTGGTLRPSALGVRMRDVQLALEARHENDLNIIQVSDLEAKVNANTPQVTGHGEIRLRDLTPHSGSFELNAQDLEISQASAPLATVTGALSADLTAKEDALLVSVRVRKFLADLAEGVDDELIDMNDNPDVQVIQEPRRAQVDQRVSSLPVWVNLDLGNDTRIRNSLIDVRLGGTPTLDLSSGVALHGGIELRHGGKFVVLGRSFVVDRGLILFDTGDSADPHLQIGAIWAAPNNVTVRLDVGGTLSAPTLSWSSEPSLPGGEEEVLALVIGGGGSGSGLTRAGSIALVANELSTVKGLEFYSTQQTSSGDGRVASLNDTSWDSYTASYQINDKLWFEGSYKRQTSANTTEVRDGVSGTLDWRFLPQWALRTELGTLGMGLDLLWQYRY